MERNTKNSIELIIDTSTFFSALYNRNGNEAELFNLADKGLFKIVIFQYVYDELEAVFSKKQVDFGLVIDLLDTYRNITLEDIEDLTDEEISLAIELISDPKDRPIYIRTQKNISGQ